MLGAIPIIKEWREECKKHLAEYGLECENCKIKKECRSYPSNWTDEDIRELVIKLSSGGKDNEQRRD